MIKFEVPGRAVAAVRTTQRKKFVSKEYKKYKAYKEYFGFYARQAVKKMITGPIEVRAIAYIAGQESDVDNLGKSFLDSCNKVVWKDDIQVRRLIVEKRRAMKDRQRVEIEIHELEPEMTEDNFELWYEEYQQGKSFAWLEKKYGVSGGTINTIFKSRGWAIRKPGRQKQAREVEENASAKHLK